MIRLKLRQRCCNVVTISATIASISTLALIIRSHQLSARDATSKQKLSKWWHLLRTVPSAKFFLMLRVSLAAGSTQVVSVKTRPKADKLQLKVSMMNTCEWHLRKGRKRRNIKCFMHPEIQWETLRSVRTVEAAANEWIFNKVRNPRKTIMFRISTFNFK